MFFIREWPDKTATLMADNGAVLWTFPSVEEARQVCRDWYRMQEIEQRAHGECLDPMVSTCTVA